MHQWEVVLDEDCQRIRRAAVPGGWLYQVELCVNYEGHQHGRMCASGWHPPVFVPEVKL